MPNRSGKSSPSHHEYRRRRINELAAALVAGVKEQLVPPLHDADNLAALEAVFHDLVRVAAAAGLPRPPRPAGLPSRDVEGVYDGHTLYGPEHGRDLEATLAWVSEMELWVIEADVLLAAPAPPSAAVIIYHGRQLYSIGDYLPIAVPDAEDCVLRAFLRQPAMVGSELENISGVTRPDLVLHRIARKYGKRFAPAIEFPEEGRRGTGGYRVAIRPAEEG